MSGEKIWLFDTTLRDGGQTRGVDFSRADKLAIAHALDDIGIDYVEGGWPGANPTDDAFFANPPALKTAKLFAFGMTRRGGRSTANDPGLNAVIDAEVDGACLVGKTWDFHVKTALNTTLEENLEMIRDSLAAVKQRGREPMFDCEHFLSRSKTAQQLRLKQTHHRLQILGTGVKPQKVLPDGREITPGQCFWGFQTSGGTAAIHPLDPFQDVLLREGRFQFRVNRLRQRRFGEDVGIRVVFNPLDRLEATEPLHHQMGVNDPSLADLNSSKPDSGAGEQWRGDDGGCCRSVRSARARNCHRPGTRARV